MDDWQNLPPELLSEIFRHLPRRDRLTCSMVCQRWHYALDCVYLWRTMAVRIDTDLMEPSTMVLTRCYYKYIRTLELGWTSPQSRWLPYHHQELTKRAVRYLLVLDECFVQITCMKLCDWFDNFRFKKIMYHLCRFLRHQFNLKKLILSNANLPKPDHLKLIESCMSSKDTLNLLDIRSDYYNRHIFENPRFLSCVRQLKNLRVIRMDYMVLTRGVFDAILRSQNTNLEQLDITVLEIYGWIITKEQWIYLSQLCPNLKVTFYIKNVHYFDEICFFLEKNVHFKDFSVHFCNA